MVTKRSVAGNSDSVTWCQGYYNLKLGIENENYQSCEKVERHIFARFVNCNHSSNMVFTKEANNIKHLHFTYMSAIARAKAAVVASVVECSGGGRAAAVETAAALVVSTIFLSLSAFKQ